MDLFSTSFPKIFPLISLSCFHSRPTVEFTLGIHREFFASFLRRLLHGFFHAASMRLCPAQRGSFDVGCCREDASVRIMASNCFSAAS